MRVWTRTFVFKAHQSIDSSFWRWLLGLSERRYHERISLGLAMKFKLDTLHMTLLAALGLDLGCAVRPVGPQVDDDGSDTGDGDMGDGDTGDGDGDGDTGDGDGDGDTGDGDTGDGDGDTPDPFACENPQPILQPDSNLPSGFVMCDGGFIHRDEQLAASDPQGLDDESCALDEGGCKTSADCLDDSYGRCRQEPTFGTCLCDYGCATDADCEDGFICAPSGVVGTHSTCIAAECTIDDECGEGLCGVSDYDGCCGTEYMTACSDPNESCHVDSECPDAPCSPEFPERGIVEYQCSYQSDYGAVDEAWTCEPPGWCNCDCGRPFFVDGDARVAPTLARQDWCLTPVRELLPVDPATRARLVEHWTQIAQYEHASVASFARFGLQLMQLGAPPKLLRDTSHALADEIEHARLAFGLASAYADAPIGPGPLDVAAALAPTLDLPAILEGLIVEACVGETLAAIEAHEAACWAEDPTVAAVLERIANDEWRHAQLGWRALGWVLAQGDARLRSFALSRFEAALAAVETNRASSGGDQQLSSRRNPAEFRRHGVLDEALRDEVRRTGIASVIRPCLAALRGVKGKECEAAGPTA
jgi:hypothetical protein